MASIVPIPTTRVSDILTRQRLLSQLQTDQLALFKLQNQLSTGRRVGIPSEDAPASLRAISLQSLLERKKTVQENLATNQSYLAATDSALSGTAGMLASIRASALSVASTTNTDTERAAVALEVERAIQQLIDVGNQRFRDRYLFAGTKTSERPFGVVNGLVQYQGNEGVLRSYADIDLLFETNLNGTEVFGGLSAAVEGSVDLNPILTSRTPLDDLRNGQGISRGGVELFDGTNGVVVDISKAKTIGEVAALLEANPPPGRVVTATVTPTGLNVQLDGGVLSIREVGGGTTAAELGIFEPSGGGPGPIVGSDLNPAVTRTTRLENILGIRATARIQSTGANNDLNFEAKSRGAEFNDVTIVYVDGGPGTAGAETAVYDDSDPMNKTLTVTIESGVSTANAVIAAVDAQTPFRATLDPQEPDNDGTGVVLSTGADPGATDVTAGGSGVEFDQTSGLRIVNGGQTYNVSFQAAETVEDLLNILNASPANVLAELNANGTGINIRSRVSGADFAIGENGGATATQLGVRSFTGATRLADLNYGRGVATNAGADFIIQRKDGTQLSIDASAATTVQDVLDLVNNHPDNQDLDPNVRVVARLATFGNGIELVTADNATTAPFEVRRVGGSLAGEQLGLLPIGQDQSPPPSVVGGLDALTGRDVNPLEVAGVFTALTRLRDALENNDGLALGRAVELLDEASLQLTFSRSELGARQQTLDVMRTRLETEEIELKGTLSDEIDADLAEVISEFLMRQAALQASLQTLAQTFRLTLLDYL